METSPKLNEQCLGNQCFYLITAEWFFIFILSEWVWNFEKEYTELISTTAPQITDCSWCDVGFYSHRNKSRSHSPHVDACKSRRVQNSFVSEKRKCIHEKMHFMRIFQMLRSLWVWEAVSQIQAWDEVSFIPRTILKEKITWKGNTLKRVEYVKISNEGFEVNCVKKVSHVLFICFKSNFMNKCIVSHMILELRIYFLLLWI